MIFFEKKDGLEKIFFETRISQRRKERKIGICFVSTYREYLTEYDLKLQ